MLKLAGLDRGKVVRGILLCLIWLAYVTFEFVFIRWFSEAGFVDDRETGVSFSIWGIIVVTVLIGPLAEEAIFRLPLSLKKKHILVAALIAIGYTLFLWIGFSGSGVFFVSTLVIGVLVLSVKPFVSERTLGIVRDRYLIYVIGLSLIFFTVGHYSRFQFDSRFHAVVYLLVVYFLFGLFLSYARIRFGFWTAVFFHALSNSIPYLILLYYSVKKGVNLFIYV